MDAKFRRRRAIAGLLLLGAAAVVVTLVLVLGASGGSVSSSEAVATGGLQRLDPASTTAPATAAATTTQLPATTTGPSPRAAPAPAPTSLRPLAGKTVVIDPGHDGANGSHPDEINREVDIGNGRKACDTAGAETASGYTESAYNLAVGLALRRVLKRLGAHVVMTRKTDDGVGPCINERARIGNDAHADAAISIHADGGPDSGRGFHVIHPAPIAGLNAAIAAPSKRLAVDVRAAYERATAEPRANYIGQDGLDERSDLGGLNLSTVPKVFIETGNMNSPTDAARLQDAAFRRRAANGIARGIERFLQR